MNPTNGILNRKGERGGGDQKHYRLLNTHQMAIQMGLSYGELRRYIARGFITPDAVCGKGQPLFFSGNLEQYKKLIEAHKCQQKKGELLGVKDGNSRILPADSLAKIGAYVGDNQAERRS